MFILKKNNNPNQSLNKINYKFIIYVFFNLISAKNIFNFYSINLFT